MKKILIVSIIVLLLLVVIPKLKATPVNPDEWQIPLAQVYTDYDKATAENVEKIFRLETANFTSNGYRQTKSPGMAAFTTSYPYGWDSMKPIWEMYKGQYKPTGTITLAENQTGKSVRFIVFKDTLSAMETLAFYLQSHNPGNWFSNDPSDQIAYENKLATITSSFVDSLT
jgi:hypothetical protein